MMAVMAVQRWPVVNGVWDVVGRGWRRLCSQARRCSVDNRRWRATTSKVIAVGCSGEEDGGLLFEGDGVGGRLDGFPSGRWSEGLGMRC